MVLGAELDRPDGALDGIGVDFDAAVVEEEAKPLPMAQRVTDRLSEGGFGREAAELLLNHVFIALTSGRLSIRRTWARWSDGRPRMRASI
jgi:hypothetical protein